MSGFDYDGLLRQNYRNALQHEQERVKEARRRKTMAAVVDFASNLLSLVGRYKGARYPVATDNLSKYQELYEKAKEKYAALLADYNGAVAARKLGLRTDNGGKALGSLAGKPPGLIKKEPSVAVPKLRSGEFEKAVKNYYSNNK